MYVALPDTCPFVGPTDADLPVRYANLVIGISRLNREKNMTVQNNLIANWWLPLPHSNRIPMSWRGDIQLNNADIL